MKPSNNNVFKPINDIGLFSFPDPENDVGSQSVFPDLESINENPEYRPQQAESKLNWMPDAICKTCYSCEQPFTLIRRRHHCRFCGQVFCSFCCSYFIDGHKIGKSGSSLRACKLCYEQVLRTVTASVRKLAPNPVLGHQVKQEGEITVYDESDDEDTFNVVTEQKPVILTAADILFGRIPHDFSFDISDVSAYERFSSPFTVSSEAEAWIEADFRNVVYDGSAYSLKHHADSTVRQLVQCMLSSCAAVPAERLDKWEKVILSLCHACVDGYCGIAKVDVNDSCMDIRQYVKIKTIPTTQHASTDDVLNSFYVNGVIFRKNIASKHMPLTISNPKILMLSGGLEFQREGSKLVYFDSIMEQEDVYLAGLTDKILKYAPDIVMTGKPVARYIQETLIEKQVTLFQCVKPSVLNRVSRMVGGSLLSETDHTFSDTGNILGSCGSFKMLFFADVPISSALNNIIADESKSSFRNRKSQPKTSFVALGGCLKAPGCTIVLLGIESKLELRQVKQVLRMAIFVAYNLKLEAALLRDRYSVMKSSFARCDSTIVHQLDNVECTDADVKTVANECYDEYFMNKQPSGLVNRVFNGAPLVSCLRHLPYDDSLSLGCKKIIRKAVEIARSSQLYAIQRLSLSSSIDVDFGDPFEDDVGNGNMGYVCEPLCKQQGSEFRGIELWAYTGIEMAAVRRIRRKTDVARSSIFDHQSITFTSVCTLNRTLGGQSSSFSLSKSQCVPCSPKRLSYYTNPDVTLSQFLAEFCFDISKPCPNASCRKSRLHHTLSFAHRCGKIDIALHEVQMESSSSIPAYPWLPNPFVVTLPEFLDDLSGKDINDNLRKMIFMWSYCRKCNKVVTPVLPLSSDASKLSFGKYLEISFYNRGNVCMNPLCGHNMRDDLVQHFACINLSKNKKFAYAGYSDLPEYDFSRDNLENEIIEIKARIGLTVYSPTTKLNYMLKQCGIVVGQFIYDATQPFSVFSRMYMPIDLNFHELLCREIIVLMKVEFMEIFDDFRNRISYLVSAIDNIFGASINIEIKLTLGSEIKKLLDEVEELAGSTIPQLDDLLINSHPHPLEIHQFRYPTIFKRLIFQQCRSWNKRVENIGNLIFSARQEELVSSALSDQSNSEQAPLSSDGRDSVSPPREKPDDIKSLNDQKPVAQSPRRNLSVRYSSSPNSSNLAIAVGRYIYNKGEVGFSILQAFTYGQNSSGDPAIDAELSKISKILSPDALFIPIDKFSKGYRFGLEPGRRGEVILVYDTSPASIISYSLLSSEYKRQMNILLKEEGLATSGSSFDVDTETSITEKKDSLYSAILEDEEDDLDKEAIAGGFDESERRAMQEETPETPQRLQFKLKFPKVQDNQEPADNVGASVAVADDSFFESLRDATIIAGDDAVEEKIAVPKQVDAADADRRREIAGDINRTLLERRKLERNSNTERQLLSKQKCHIKHSFYDIDESGISCKFICQSYWALQFQAMRRMFLGCTSVDQAFDVDSAEEDDQFVQSLSSCNIWDAKGGKSGASFSRSQDDRFIIKQISQTELKMFLDICPAYFEKMSRAFYYDKQTVLCKILGIYQVGYKNKLTGARSYEQIVVMENLFYGKNISRIFDLKGSARSRYIQVEKEAERAAGTSSLKAAKQVLLDDNFMEMTGGKPFPLRHRSRMFFRKAIQNDTMFLSAHNVVDYSLVVGIVEETGEIAVGIIDYMRQYDIIKKIENKTKSLGMIAGQAEPTVIQPQFYKQRFETAMEKYFMSVPDKWTSID